jgi:hypothetical protein
MEFGFSECEAWVVGCSGLSGSEFSVSIHLQVVGSRAVRHWLSESSATSTSSTCSEQPEQWSSLEGVHKTGFMYSIVPLLEVEAEEDNKDRVVRHHLPLHNLVHEKFLMCNEWVMLLNTLFKRLTATFDGPQVTFLLGVLCAKKNG